jgi:exosortase/archaeosortase family protein
MAAVVTSSQPTAERTRFLGTFWRSLPRNQFFAGLYILGCANGLGGNVVRSLSAGDWTGGIENISVLVWFALFAGISLLFGENKEEIKRGDLAVGGIFLAFIAAPASEINWAGVTGLSFYILLFAANDSTRRRAALILLALTVPMVWSPLLFAFFSKIFLEFDATLVGTLLGTNRSGNIVAFADGSGNMIVLPACSSLHNVSLAFLGWATVTQWVEHKASWPDVIWCLLACASVIAVNVVRITIMGMSQWHYQTFHYGWGATVANAIILAFIVTFTVLGVRRELFSRA